MNINMPVLVARHCFAVGDESHDGFGRLPLAHLSWRGTNYWVRFETIWRGVYITSSLCVFVQPQSEGRVFRASLYVRNEGQETGIREVGNYLRQNDVPLTFLGFDPDSLFDIEAVRAENAYILAGRQYNCR